MMLPNNYFKLLGLPVQFSLNTQDLKTRYLASIKVLHPDQFVATSWEAQSAATELAGEINTAFAKLKDPLYRAIHILALNGVDLMLDGNMHTDEAFLLTQMDFQERLSEIMHSHNQKALQAFIEEIALEVKTRFDALALLLDENVSENIEKARNCICELQFYLRLNEEAKKYGKCDSTIGQNPE
ncbi:MAG TPA: Fe-S protein assembly co-chaperone HscB [Gammaproteobacteria bacterium]|nr:Fe-S protein assembly co-chaperone HscB [Gammaproteobacteria bacterium]